MLRFRFLPGFVSPSGLAGSADRLSLFASAACLVHCLALPLIIAALPALASVLTLPESFHVWMVLLAIPTSGVALIKNGAGRAGNVTMLLGAAGLTGLAIGAFVVGGTSYETGITVTGALLLGTAHIRNWRHRRGCG